MNTTCARLGEHVALPAGQTCGTAEHLCCDEWECPGPGAWTGDPHAGCPWCGTPANLPTEEEATR